MRSVSFQPQTTWRQLGYLFYTDSLSYREVLNANTQWNVMENPPLGVSINIPGTYGSIGGLSQSSFMFSSATAEQSDRIFPFENTASYVESLNRYNLYGVYFRDSLNGYNADSTSAFTGKQG